MGSKQYNSSNNPNGGQHSKSTPDNSAGFKNVLLNVQLDALATLVDEQATRRLWKLFTNCAGSIAHGRRLENLSWRSWGRDRVVDWSGTRLKSDEYSDFDLRSKTPTKTSNESYTRPSLPRYDSSTSTSTGPPSTCSSSSLPQPSTSFIVSRSPPLGPLIKRVIFTPPEPTDHAATALQLLMTSKRRLLSQRPENSTSHNEEGQRQPTSQLSSPSQHTTFPTVVILESTPKPTPPDTPARGLSPTSDAQRSIFHHHQTLSPFHALVNPTQVVSDPEQPVPKSLTSLNPKASPAPRLTPMVVPISESSSSPAAGAMVEKIITAPVPSAPGTKNCEHKPHSRTSSLLNPTTTTVSADSRQHIHSTPTANDKVGLGMAPTSSSNRRFFLQHDSSSLSLSPDSNSRSESHSRSPASRSPGTRIAHAPSAGGDGGVYGKSNKVTGHDGAVVSRTERDDPKTKTKMEGVESKPDDNVAISRELLEESATRHNHHRPISPAAAEHSSVSVPNASSSSSSHTHPSRQQRLIMRSGKKGGYRSYLGRAHHERTSSKGSARASVGSRGSDSTSTTAGGGGRSGGAGSVDGNAGSTSASGMSTSAGSKLVMKRHPRTHSPLRNSVPVSNGAGAENATAAALPPPAHRAEQPPAASGSGQSGKKEPHVSPLAVLPEPLRMEVLERQVMQSAMKSQSNIRKISLESDSEEDYTDDVDETDGDEEIVVVKGTLKDKKSTAQRPVAEEEEGSSWSDEDDAEEVVVAKKRPQTQHEKHPGPAQTHSRRNSKDLDHLVGSAGSGRQPHGAHGRSKGKVANHHHHHPHHHVHVQRQQLSPPLRPAVARKGSSGHHTRSAPSQDGPLAQAAREALRQRDMFTPLPRETYSSTNLVREMSRTSLSRGGRPSNLTMLLNPDPQWFPQNHPYRRDVHPMDQKLSRSMEEVYARGNGQRGNGNGVKSPRPGVGLGFGGLKMTTTPAAAQVTPRTQAPVPAPVTKPASPERPPPKRSSASSKSPPPPPPHKLRPSKSAVSVPAVTGVTASSTPHDEKQTDMLEMSLRQMGPVQRRQRVTRQPHEPALPEPERRATNDQRDQHGNPSSRPSNRLGAKPTDVEFSDTEDEEAPSSPPPKVAGTSGRSLAKEHLEAVMGGKVTSAGMNASRTVVASPDVLPKESRESDPTSYRPPAPPSSPSVYNAHEAKRPQGHLPHTPPSSKRPPVARAPRIRPHSSHGQPMAEVNPPPSTIEAPQRDRRQPAISQPPVPVTTAPVHAVAPYPYNLPYPAPVQSPRTTRLNMLASEVPDDLRKDLLWERKTNRIAPILENRLPTPLAPLRRSANATGLGGGGAEVDEESELARMEREAQERYDRMRTQTWNGVIYQRPVW